MTEADKPRRVGRPRTAACLLAKELGIDTRTVKRNGLDRDISPLVRRLRMKQIERSTRGKQKHKGEANDAPV